MSALAASYTRFVNNAHVEQAQAVLGKSHARATLSDLLQQILLQAHTAMSMIALTRPCKAVWRTCDRVVKSLQLPKRQHAHELALVRVKPGRCCRRLACHGTAVSVSDRCGALRQAVYPVLRDLGPTEHIAGKAMTCVGACKAVHGSDLYASSCCRWHGEQSPQCMLLHVIEQHRISGKAARRLTLAQAGRDIRHRLALAALRGRVHHTVQVLLSRLVTTACLRGPRAASPCQSSSSSAGAQLLPLRLQEKSN